MKPEGSSPFSQKSTTGLYPEPAESSLVVPKDQSRSEALSNIS
jgi:hypothetical protein